MMGGVRCEIHRHVQISSSQAYTRIRVCAYGSSRYPPSFFGKELLPKRSFWAKKCLPKRRFGKHYSLTFDRESSTIVDDFALFIPPEVVED